MTNYTCTHIEYVRKLERENKRIRETLEFYADITRWSGTRIIGDHYKDFESGNASIFIGGERARKALEGEQ